MYMSIIYNLSIDKSAILILMNQKGPACRQAGFAPILIVILVAAALLGGYFIYQKSTNKPTSSPEPSPLSTKAPSEVEDPITKWKTYQDIRERYTFRYPPEWQLTSDNIDKQTGYARFSYWESGKKYDVIIGAYGHGGPKADDSKSDTLTYANLSYSQDSWIKNNKPFYVVARPNVTVKGDWGGNMEINLPDNNPEKYLELFHQALSTFKFTQ